MERFDYTIIGGGIFGIYAAVYLAEKGAEICLIEKEHELFRRASLVNQARIHSGYHYPRSVATAKLSEEYKARFIRDHEQFINKSFRHYYAIDRFSSVTDPAQFERFCRHLNIPCNRISGLPFLKKDRVEAIFETEEFSFDPILISKFYKDKLKTFKNILIRKRSRINEVNVQGGDYELAVQNIDSQKVANIISENVVNATYAGTNGVQSLFNLSQIELTHEIAEMVFVKTNLKDEFGLTIMDGQFCSLMPYGLSGFQSLSSVSYTPHEVSKSNKPSFHCQDFTGDCSPSFLKNCNDCSAKPKSNFLKMKNQISAYLDQKVKLDYGYSKFTVKSKLKSSHIDDSRPTRILKLSQNPGFYCIFAGKINSIYEIEKMLM